ASRRLLWRLSVAPRRRLPATVELARDESASGRLDDAAETLAKALEHASEPVRADLLSALARAELARGRLDEASARFEAAIELHDASGRRSAACDDALALAFLLLGNHRVSEARVAIDRAAGFAADYPDGRVNVAYSEGLLAAETGDHRTAV